MKNKKHIDIIVKYFYPVVAGIETNILETHKHFIEKGWSVTVHASKDTLTEKGILNDTDEIQGIRIVRYPYGIFGFFPKLDWKNTNVVSLHNFNIFPHLQIMLYVLMLKIARKKRFIFSLTPHGGFNPDWRIFNKLVAMLKSLYHFTVGTILINLSLDVVRAVSEWEAKNIRSKGVNDEKVRKITNGTEDEAYQDVDKLASKEIKKNVKSWSIYIIQIGRVYKIKNYETAIRALALLPNEINYVIAGPIQDDDSYKKKLEKLIKELGLENRVIFAGVIRGIDKYYMIKHAKLMVHMALYESYCNVVHEGMSKGLVCVVADNTALKYLIENNVNGYRIEENDYRSVAKKINYVLENEDSIEIKKIKETNIKFALGNSWRDTSDALRKIYEGGLR